MYQSFLAFVSFGICNLYYKKAIAGETDCWTGIQEERERERERERDGGWTVPLKKTFPAFQPRTAT